MTSRDELSFIFQVLHTHTHTILLRKEQLTFREGLWFFFSPGPEIFLHEFFDMIIDIFLHEFFQTS